MTVSLWEFPLLQNQLRVKRNTLEKLVHHEALMAEDCPPTEQTSQEPPYFKSKVYETEGMMKTCLSHKSFCFYCECVAYHTAIFTHVQGVGWCFISSYWKNFLSNSTLLTCFQQQTRWLTLCSCHPPLLYNQRLEYHLMWPCKKLGFRTAQF